jgi:hypothetical protein
MTDHHGGLDLVAMLPARAAAPGRGDITRVEQFVDR